MCKDPRTRKRLACPGNRKDTDVWGTLKGTVVGMGCSRGGG